MLDVKMAVRIIRIKHVKICKTFSITVSFTASKTANGPIPAKLRTRRHLFLHCTCLPKHHKGLLMKVLYDVSECVAKKTRANKLMLETMLESSNIEKKDIK